MASSAWGDMSAAFTEAVIAAGKSRLDPMTALSTIADGVKSLGSLTSTIISIVQMVMRLTALDVTVRGFVLNASPDPLTYIFGSGDNPHLENCANVTGPLGTVLPGMRQIADPDTGELVDCVAMSPWSITNDKGHTGAFATVIARMAKPDWNGYPNVALGWGVPYAQGGPRTAIQPTDLTDAGEFYAYTDGEFGEAHSQTDVGVANIITAKNSLNTSIGRFLIFYSAGAPL